jgi:hypothetical protein
VAWLTACPPDRRTTRPPADVGAHGVLAGLPGGTGAATGRRTRDFDGCDARRDTQPLPDEQGVAVDSAPVVVAVVGSRHEADLIVGLLRAHGLTAAAVTDDAGGQEPQLQLDGVRVLVPSAHAASARRVLGDIEEAAPRRSDVHPRTEREPS